MSTKNKKSDAIKFLEKISGAPLTIGRLMRSIRLGEEATLKEFSEKFFAELVPLYNNLLFPLHSNPKMNSGS